jgi:tetratricopeptide (TPR) repeat protein
MSIIEQTLNRLDADNPLNSQGDQHFTPGFAMRRRSSSAKWFVLAGVALALGGGGVWWSTRMSGSDFPLAIAADKPLPAVSAPSAVEPARLEPQIVGALPIVRPSPSSVMEQGPGLSQTTGGLAAKPYLDTAPPWLVRGMTLYGRGDKDDARAIWMEGVMGLPGHHMMLNLPLLNTEAAAVQVLASLSALYPVMLLTTKKDGKLVNQLLSYVDGEENPMLASALSKQLGEGGLRWVSVAALRLQLPARAMEAVPLAVAVPVENGKPLTKVDAPRQVPVAARPAAPKPVQIKPVALSAPAVAVPVVQGESVISEPPPMLERAEKMINANQSVEALFELRGAKGRQLEDWRYHYLVGVAEMKLGRKDKAQDALSASIKINPRQAEPLLKRAVLGQDAGQHNDAMADLRAAEKIAPLMPEVHLNIGYSADALGRTADAKVAYLRFLGLSQAKSSYGGSREWVSKRLRDLNGDTP